MRTKYNFKYCSSRRKKGREEKRKEGRKEGRE
jgi:hypothetical protein